MIAFVCAGAAEARELAGVLAGPVRRADGPFFVSRGVGPGGQPWSIWEAGEGVEAHYAAGRMAARRGASALVHLGEAEAAPALWREWDGEPAGLLEISGIFDLRGLADAQALTPDSAPKSPVPLPAGVPGTRRSTSTEGGFLLGSVGIPLTSCGLADLLYTENGIGLFDREACGLVDAALDAGVACAVCKQCLGSVGSRPRARRGGFAAERKRAEIALELISGLDIVAAGG